MNAEKILHVACSDEELRVLRMAFAAENLHLLPMNMDLLIEPVEVKAALIVVGHETKNTSLLEIIQCLKLTYSSAVILLAEKAIPFAKKDLIKNGFTDVFYIPLEIEFFLSRANQIASFSGNGDKTLCSVKVNDLIDISDLSIDTFVFLPSNNRYVSFNISGDVLNDEKKKKLKEKDVTNIYIDIKDLPTFYQAYAESIKKIQLSSKISETQKREILREICRDLLADIFTDAVTGMNTSMKVNQSCKEIILSYLSDANDIQKWHDKLNSTAGDKDDFYSNSSNTMIASVLIGIGLGLEQKNIEALAIAALLRDLGLSMLPGYLVSRSMEEMTSEERELYQKYPIHTVELLKHKKVILPELSQKIILQQHEKFDGSGFPNALMGKQIIQESQILLLVDNIISKISHRPGKQTMKFKDAFAEFRDEYYKDPSKCSINPAYLNEINDLLNSKRSIGENKKDLSGGKWTMS